jgi:hypothetical protein
MSFEAEPYNQAQLRYDALKKQSNLSLLKGACGILVLLTLHLGGGAIIYAFVPGRIQANCEGSDNTCSYIGDATYAAMQAYTTTGRFAWWPTDGGTQWFLVMFGFFAAPMAIFSLYAIARMVIELIGRAFYCCRSGSEFFDNNAIHPLVMLLIAEIVMWLHITLSGGLGYKATTELQSNLSYDQAIMCAIQDATTVGCAINSGGVHWTNYRVFFILFSVAVWTIIFDSLSRFAYQTFLGRSPNTGYELEYKELMQVLALRDREIETLRHSLSLERGTIKNGQTPEIPMSTVPKAYDNANSAIGTACGEPGAIAGRRICL